MASAENLARRVRRMKESLREDLEETVDDGVEDTHRKTDRNLSQNDSVVTGDLVSSGHTVDDPRNNYAKALRYEADHAPYVEWGTGAFTHTDAPIPFGTPTLSQTLIENLQTWIDEKPVNGEWYRDTYDPSRDTYGSPLAWAIARTIAELGNKAHPFLGPAWRIERKRTRSRARYRLRRNVRRF